MNYLNKGINFLIKEEEKKRINEEVKTDHIVDPEFIVWKNYSNSKLKRFGWNFLSFVIYLVLILF